jgi:uncharacterized protein
MVIDCHYHLEERLLPVNELMKKMDQSGVDKIALMGLQIDPYPEPSRLLISLLQILLTKRPLRRLGKSFIANFTNDGIKILGNNYPLKFEPDNEPVFNLVSAHPDKFLGWIFINPKGKKDQVTEFEKWKMSKGCVGIKAHAFWNHHTPLELRPVAEKVAAAGLPLIIHLGYGSEGDYSALLDAVPNLKLILAHAGFPGYSDTWKNILPRKNVYVDLSQTSYVGVKTIKDAVGYLGVERCLFGTDGPYGFHGADGKFDYGLIKRRIESIFPDSGIRKRLLGDNFQELAGIL